MSLKVTAVLLVLGVCAVAAGLSWGWPAMAIVGIAFSVGAVS